MIRTPLVLFCLSLVVLMIAGCKNPKAPTTGSFYADLQSPDPIVVLNASVRAGEEQDYNAVPYLLENLRHDLFTIRHSAHMALLMLYHGIPFKFEGPPPRPFAFDAVEPSGREAAVRGWEAWWKKKRAQLIQAAEDARNKKDA